MIGSPGGTPERPAVFFTDAAEFRRWLQRYHDTANELWMGLYKKHVTEPGLRWEDAVAEALCFGWIDSQVQRVDADAVRQRWTPRKPGSVWSQVNVTLVKRLTAQGLMHPAGLAAFARRSPQRTGIYTHEQGDLVLRAEDEARLRADPAAAAFWDAATPSYRKIAINWIRSAKRMETRERRLMQLIEDSTAGRLIPSQRYGAEPAWARRARGTLDNVRG